MQPIRKTGTLARHLYKRAGVPVLQIFAAAAKTRTVSNTKHRFTALTTDDIRQDDWNEVHVVVRGFRFYFTINGKMASEVIDNEVAKRIDRGAIGLQLHGGKPMTIEFRDIRLADLSAGRSTQ